MNTLTNLYVITSKDEWRNALNTCESYDFYHTYDYHELSKSARDQHVLLKYKEGGIIICLPLIIREIENTEYFDATSVYGYAGPLQKKITDDFDNSNFLKSIDSFFKNRKIISVFSRLNPFIKNQETILKSLGEIIQLGNVVNIDLTKSLNKQQTFYSKTTKRYINKASKSLEIRFSRSKEDILVFKKLYHENMNRVNAQKKYYFDDDYLFKFTASQDFKTEVLLAVIKETQEIISGAMMVKTKNIIQYHISGTKTEFLNLSPIRLIIDETRIKNSNKKYQYFNLGGGVGNNDDDLFKFKSSFSKDFKSFKIWKYVANIEVYNNLVKHLKHDESITFFPLYRYLDN